MIVSAIVDPEIFGTATIQNSTIRDKAVALLKGLATNGVWIDKAKSNSLLDQAIKAASGLDTKLGQRVLVALQELKKDWKRHVAAFGRLDDSIEDGGFARQANELFDKSKPDGVFVSDTNRKAVEAEAIPDNMLVQIDEFHDSGFENLRISLMEPEKPLNELQQSEIENLIGRVLKFSSRLHVFDYLMAGKRGSAKSNFLPGIQQLVDIWEKFYVLGSSVPRTLLLYPAAERPLQAGTLTCEEVDCILSDCIVDELHCPSIAVERHPKKDPDNFCHARGFLAKRRAYTIDPGIDAFKVIPPTRTLLLSRSKAAEVYFCKYQALKGIEKN